VALYRQVLAQSAPGQTIVALNRAGPTGLAGVVDHGPGNLKGCDDPGADPLPCVLDQQPDVLLTFTSTEKLGVYLENRPPGWTREVVDRLVATGRYELVHQDGFDAVLRRTG
jgi:hypothetical protein